jgi:cell division protein FtsQ
MNVAVKEMISLGPLWRRAARRMDSHATLRRKPVVPVTRRWEGVAASLRGALIMASGLVLAGILGWLWATLTDPRWLPIKQVQVQGPFIHVDDRAVRDAAAPYLTGNFLTVDVRGVRRAVEALPWVRHAEVRRVWPNAIHVSVIEQVAVADWGTSALVNDEGDIFQPPGTGYPANLSHLRGPDGSGPSVVATFQDMSAIVAPLKVRIVSLSLDDRRAWSLELDNGMHLVLGRGNGYERLLKFARFYHRALHDREAQVERVDLRYSNGFAVRWKEAGRQ